MRLSEAIRRGARLKGQARGRLHLPSRSATCALGAAADALGAWEDGHRPAPDAVLRRLRELFPILMESLRPGGESVEKAIMGLNDGARWSRERIAVRVERWEVALGYGPSAALVVTEESSSLAA